MKVRLQIVYHKEKLREDLAARYTQDWLGRRTSESSGAVIAMVVFFFEVPATSPTLFPIQRKVHKLLKMH
jgi:hypothetical protein